MFKFATQKLQRPLDRKLGRRMAFGLTGSYLATQLYRKSFESYERPVFQRESSVTGGRSILSMLDFSNLPVTPFRSHESLADDSASDQELLKKVQGQVDQLNQL